jgi:hypothetical protein
MYWAHNLQFTLRCKKQNHEQNSSLTVTWLQLCDVSSGALLSGWKEQPAARESGVPALLLLTKFRLKKEIWLTWEQGGLAFLQVRRQTVCASEFKVRLHCTWKQRTKFSSLKPWWIIAVPNLPLKWTILECIWQLMKVISYYHGDGNWNASPGKKFTRFPLNQ